MEPGTHVVVRTPDRREFRGTLIEVRHDSRGRDVALVRLDSGWETTYPCAMVYPERARD